MSVKNDAPRCFRYSKTTWVVVEKSVDFKSCDEEGKTELHKAKFLRRSNAIGVFRTGAPPRGRSLPFSPGDRKGGVSLAQTTSPERHNESSQDGSYSCRRLGSSSPSHAEAGASKPSNCSMIALTLSGPSIW